MTSGRFLFLLGLAAAVAIIDLARHRERARKWREYSIVLAGGCAGSLFGLLNDALVTSAISPEYFIYGKGLEPDEHFRARVALLGLQAGFGPGAVALGLLLFFDTRRPDRPSLGCAAVLRAAWMPLAAAVALGIVLPLLFSARDPLGFRATLELALRPDEIRRFLVVWWIHLGLYAGFVAGTAAGAVRLHRRRRALALTPPPAQATLSP